MGRPMTNVNATISPPVRIDFLPILSQVSGAQSLTTANQSTQPSTLLPAVVDGWIDGILILTDQNQLVYVNESARRVLRQFQPDISCDSFVPKEISHICQYLIHSRRLFPHQHWLAESEIFTDDAMAVHIRARWLQVEAIANPCLLLTIEDRYQALKNIAVESAQKYGLTPREKEVWLLHRANYTYKEIAAELFITPNTVKKHMRSIHIKQKEKVE
jgi:DNA-binding CsgD family transcriptional regulator